MATGRPTIATPAKIKDAWDYVNGGYAIDVVHKDTDAPSPAGKAESGIEGFHKTKPAEKFPSVAGLALWLHISRDSLYERKEFSDILAIIKLKQELLLVNKSIGGDYNPTIAKLLLSSKHGYVERSAADITTNGESLNKVEPNEQAAADYAAWLKQKGKE